MTPIDQSIMHEPTRGLFGDGMRASVASLLDLPATSVPHFNEGGPSESEFDRRFAEFLEQYGLVEFSMPAEAAGKAHYIRDLHHLMYGYTVRGTYHVVVGLNGVVVHDPHPTKTGLIEDGRIRHAYLVRVGSPKVAA